MYGCIIKWGCAGLARFTVWRTRVCCVFCWNSFCELIILLPHNPASNMKPLLTKSWYQHAVPMFRYVVGTCWQIFCLYLFQFFDAIIWNVYMYYWMWIFFVVCLVLWPLFACVWKTFFIHSWRTLVRCVNFGSSS